MERFCSHSTDFHEIWYLSVFQKYVEKIQVPLKSENNDGYCIVLYCIVLYCIVYEEVRTFTATCRSFVLEMKMFQAKFVVKINTYFMLNIFPQNRAVYEIYVLLCNLCIFMYFMYFYVIYVLLCNLCTFM